MNRPDYKKNRVVGLKPEKWQGTPYPKKEKNPRNFGIPGIGDVAPIIVLKWLLHDISGWQ